MKIKVLKRRLNQLVSPVKDLVLKEDQRRVTLYAYYYERLPIKKGTILYESRDGASMTDNPYAMFRYMLAHPEFRDYTHIWSIADKELLAPIIQQYESYPHVKFVKRHSPAYLRALASCQYVINNSTFPTYYIPKKGQVYINTWHGTPLKYMGFDIPGNPAHSQNVLRNFLSTDFLISANEHMTNMYTKSYKLDGLYNGKIIETGYPRIDLTIHTDPFEFRKRLEDWGIILEDKPIILYAPTWKGTDVTQVKNDVKQIHADMVELRKQVGDQYNILVKVHPFLYKQAKDDEGLIGRLIPDFVDTNELLSVVDILITDYSSIFFDFLITGKPILFYTWDLDVYMEERGQYFHYNELPGPHLFTVWELATAIKNIDKVQVEYKFQYEKMKERFTQYEDGKVRERIISYIFQNKDQHMKVIQNLHQKKKKILIYSGGLRNNGITTSFINLMNNINHNEYDVTCFTATPESEEVLNNVAKINKNVRLVFKPGRAVYNFMEMYRDKFIHYFGKKGYLGKTLFPEQAYKREHRRLFGKSQFDYVIDFSGYSLYWAKYLIVADAKRKICFMHNDLLSDSERTVNGKKPHRINLRGLFTIYNEFDKLVSVSEGTMELNKKNLSQYAPPEKFAYVLNSINPEKILQGDSMTEPKDGEEKLQVEYYKARAVLKDGSQLWNTIPIFEHARLLTLEQPLQDQEVFIFRKAVVDGKTYYKLMKNFQVLGWVEEQAITFLPDTVIEEKEVNKLGRITKPKGKLIWTKPYRVPGAERVSSSSDYKDVIVDMDREAETPRGTYCRISVNGIQLGWIHQSALHIYEYCTLRGTETPQEKAKILFKRKLIKSLYERRKKEVLKNIHNRPLREIRIVKQVYAKITNPEKQMLWTHAYPHWKAKPIAPAKWLEGEYVVVRAVIQTRAGVFCLIYKDEKRLGWLHARALEKVTEPTIIKEESVDKAGTLRLGKKFAIWTKPGGLPESKKVVNYQRLDGLEVKINQLVVTQKGSYYHVEREGIPLGWVYEEGVEIVEEVRSIPEPDPNYINFANMGRLSPEKGQDNLLKAFAQFQKEYPNSRLYILGDGPLKKDLQNLIEELGIQQSAFLLGQVEYPFSFLKKCDCFILSSHYEGQPMVLLEAMTLGMNIVATDIVANRTVLENGKYGLLVENSIDGLVSGMKSIAENREKKWGEPFDYKFYNEMAMESFYQPLMETE